MDFPSQDWEFNDLDDFDTAPPTITGDCTFELYAQLRATGRILDNFRAVLGGTKMLYVNASLTDMIPSDQFKGWSYRTQRHPRDLALRRNMLSTAWMDMPASLLFNDASIHDQNGESRRIAKAEVVERVAGKTSLMPDGLALLLTEAEFADLVAYLGTLKMPTHR